MLKDLNLTKRRVGGIARGGRYLPMSAVWYILRWGDTEYLVRWVPHHGRAVVGRRPRGFPAPMTWEETWEVTMAIKRPKPPVEGEEAGPVNLAAAETKIFGKLAAIVEHVISTRYADNSPRKGSLVMIDTLGSAWRVRVTDPDTARRLTCLGPTLDEALALVEAHLRAEDCPWEVDSYAQGTKKKK